MNLDKVYDFLQGTETYYPNFKSWFEQKAYPDLVSGKRTIVSLKVLDEIEAIAILKLSKPKICTFKTIIPEYRTILMLDVLELVPNPVITICEEKYLDYDPFLKEFGFTLRQIEEGKYRVGKLEYVYKRGD